MSIAIVCLVSLSVFSVVMAISIVLIIIAKLTGDPLTCFKHILNQNSLVCLKPSLHSLCHDQKSKFL